MLSTTRMLCFLQASTDQSAVDTEVPLAYGSMLAMIFAMLGICVVTLTVTREVVIILLPLTWAYYFYQVRASDLEFRELKLVLPQLENRKYGQDHHIPLVAEVLPRHGTRADKN